MLSLRGFDAATVARTGARCLDGSPSGYYFRKGTGSGETSWVVYMQVSFLSHSLILSFLFFISPPPSLSVSLPLSLSLVVRTSSCTRAFLQYM